MRPLWKDVVTALFMGLILPGLMLNFAVLYLDSRSAQAPQPPQETQSPPSGLTMELLTEDGSRETHGLEAYLTGVVLAEMPAFFETEALKAQAVAARTYAWKARTTGGKHGNSALCADPGCCQAYLTEERYLAMGGTPEGLEKVRSAVLATAGQVLTYGGELIEATYFSCSGGRTEDAAAVWGKEFPYLQSVDSPGEEAADHFTDTQAFSPGEFIAALGISDSGDPASWLGMTTYTEGGGVHTMVIGGRSFTGTELRSLLGLRSTAFSITVGETEISITTRGYGHRVGLSQFGADAMAVAGSSYQEILSHYYGGTELIQLSEH